MFNFSIKIPYNFEDGRFDWSATLFPECGQCQDRHPVDIGCQGFRTEQINRLKIDLVAYFWYAGYRKIPLNSVYDTTPFIPESKKEEYSFFKYTPFKQ